MILLCIHCLVSKILDVLPLIISLFSLIVAFYSLMANSEPVIAYLWHNGSDNGNKYYYIKNVGKGPAMNIIVSYIKNNDKDGKVNEWKNPVRCYSLAPNEIIPIDWGIKSGGELVQDTYTQPAEFISGVDKIGTVYSSSNFLIKRTYTSTCEHDTTEIKNGNQIRQWKDDEVSKVWNLNRSSEKKNK